MPTTLKQTTIVESATLPILGSLGIPGMKLIAWCEDKEPREPPLFAVFLEAESGIGDCLFLEFEPQDGFSPGGSNWTMMKRADVASLLAYDDPEYEGLNYLVSRDPFWIEAIKKQSCLT